MITSAKWYARCVDCVAVRSCCTAAFVLPNKTWVCALKELHMES